MALDINGYNQYAEQAIMQFWANRRGAAEKHRISGKSDAGERAGVTSGKNMDGFITLVEALVKNNGLMDAEVHLQRRVLALPGYFRPTKLWDILITRNGQLIAALEFKSQVGPSFGNNFNNRTEEAIGTALDFWTAYREGAFGAKSPRPFIGWLMLLEDCEGSHKEVNETSPHFDVFPEFQKSSYATRYNLLCRKLIQEQLYTAACIIRSPRTAYDTGNYSDFSDITSLKNFVIGLAGHIAAEAAR